MTKILTTAVKIETLARTINTRCLPLIQHSIKVSKANSSTSIWVSEWKLNERCFFKRIVDLDFLVNGLERQLGYDLNGDGYIGGEGKMNARATERISTIPSLCFSRPHEQIGTLHTHRFQRWQRHRSSTRCLLSVSFDVRRGGRLSLDGIRCLSSLSIFLNRHLINFLFFFLIISRHCWEKIFIE